MVSTNMGIVKTNRKYFYVRGQNKFMRQAKRVAEESLDPDWPTGVVVVKDNRVIGRGWNGSEYHQKFGCERKRLRIKTGERYDLCQGCDPKNHAEARAVRSMGAEVYSEGASSAYLWGHWWCCEPCWRVMVDAGIGRVYLLKHAKVVFGGKRGGTG